MFWIVYFEKSNQFFGFTDTRNSLLFVPHLVEKWFVWPLIVVKLKNRWHFAFLYSWKYSVYHKSDLHGLIIVCDDHSQAKLAASYLNELTVTVVLKINIDCAIPNERGILRSFIRINHSLSCWSVRFSALLWSVSFSFFLLSFRLTISVPFVYIICLYVAAADKNKVIAECGTFCCWLEILMLKFMNSVQSTMYKKVSCYEIMRICNR